jgi:site-specific recombinase XerC
MSGFSGWRDCTAAPMCRTTPCSGLIYDAGLSGHEALSINLEDITWTERAIPIQGNGDRTREIFFSRKVATALDKYLMTRGWPTHGPLFITHRKARAPQRTDRTRDGFARLPIDTAG